LPIQPASLRIKSSITISLVLSAVVYLTLSIYTMVTLVSTPIHPFLATFLISIVAYGSRRARGEWSYHSIPLLPHSSSFTGMALERLNPGWCQVVQVARDSR
jgi:hypothetical protein